MASWVRQAGTLAVRDGRVCLITSSSGKRWVIPKGMIDPGWSAGETAANEAWEEAGLAGPLSPEPLGGYTYEKAGSTLYVSVFRLEVVEVLDDWPERSLRRREWLQPELAAERIDEPALREIILREVE